MIFGLVHDEFGIDDMSQMCLYVKFLHGEVVHICSIAQLTMKLRCTVESLKLAKVLSVNKSPNKRHRKDRPIGEGWCFTSIKGRGDVDSGTVTSRYGSHAVRVSD